MTVKMSQLLGKEEDVFQNCRKDLRLINVERISRITAEIILKNGDRRYFRAKSVDKNTGVKEILLFIDALEASTGDTVMWRLKGEKTYHMSTNYNTQPSLFHRTKNALLNYFFDLEN